MNVINSSFQLNINVLASKDQPMRAAIVAAQIVKALDSISSDIKKGQMPKLQCNSTQMKSPLDDSDTVISESSIIASMVERDMPALASVDVDEVVPAWLVDHGTAQKDDALIAEIAGHVERIKSLGEQPAVANA